jgi:hypothetical protein
MEASEAMTDEQDTSLSTRTAAAEQAADSVPTPEELLAETEIDDPDVGIDGTGVGELP